MAEQMLVRGEHCTIAAMTMPYGRIAARTMPYGTVAAMTVPYGTIAALAMPYGTIAAMTMQAAARVAGVTHVAGAAYHNVKRTVRCFKYLMYASIPARACVCVSV